MHPVDIENSLNSMTVLIDTREQPSERAEKRYKQFECSFRRQKLDFGDYSAEFMNSDNQLIQIPVAIERKMSLDELAMCFTRDRKRFQAEFERAKEQNAKMYLLVEDASFEKILTGKYRSRMNSKAFFGSLMSWLARYDITPIFCKQEVSGKIIAEILYRELRERLECGFYG